ncbi:hypothetical protein C8J57DRAFT_1727710 [Mycena rebaudengoi]|nr:hypothetical protein C8J57DRAFT_1727710 [Mycena rebaudengoi]
MSLCCQPLESGVAPKPGVGVRTVSLRLCSMAGLCLAIRCPAFYRRTMTATMIVEGRKNDSEARPYLRLRVRLPWCRHLSRSRQRHPYLRVPQAHTFTARLCWTLCAQTTAYPSIFASAAAKLLLHVGQPHPGARAWGVLKRIMYVQIRRYANVSSQVDRAFSTCSTVAKIASPSLSVSSDQAVSRQHVSLLRATATQCFPAHQRANNPPPPPPQDRRSPSILLTPCADSALNGPHQPFVEDLDYVCSGGATASVASRAQQYMKTRLRCLFGPDGFTFWIKLVTQTASADADNKERAGMTVSFEQRSGWLLAPECQDADPFGRAREIGWHLARRIGAFAPSFDGMHGVALHHFCWNDFCTEMSQCCDHERHEFNIVVTGVFPIPALLMLVDVVLRPVRRRPRSQP